MRSLVLTLFIGCYPRFPEDLAETFTENEAFDYDRDGYTERDGDCNDLNDKQNPGAEELCKEYVD